MMTGGSEDEAANIRKRAGSVFHPTRGSRQGWCIRDKDGIIAPICAFSSPADCVHAALVGPSGSVCVQQGTPAAKFNDSADKPGKRRYRREADRD
jgi:hypothetical protein